MPLSVGLVYFWRNWGLREGLYSALALRYLLLTGQAVLECSENPRCFSRFLPFPIQKYTNIYIYWIYIYIQSLFLIEVAVFEAVSGKLGQWTLFGWNCWIQRHSYEIWFLASVFQTSPVCVVSSEWAQLPLQTYGMVLLLGKACREATGSQMPCSDSWLCFDADLVCMAAWEK